MAQLIVPKEKGVDFAQELFSVLSENITFLAEENEKLPRKIVFMGQLGKELLTFIRSKGWSFDGFELESIDGYINALVFKYDAPLTQTTDPNSIMFEDGSLHGKQVNGIPGEETMHKLILSYSSPQFKVEKTVRPERRVNLKRGK